jgi:hypothetical protein
VLQAVIKCFKDHKLEAEFPLKDLHTRLKEFEKASTLYDMKEHMT